MSAAACTAPCQALPAALQIAAHSLGEVKSRLCNGVPLQHEAQAPSSWSAVGFFDLVAQPLFRSCAAVFEGAFPMLRAVEDNLRKWKALEISKAKT